MSFKSIIAYVYGGELELLHKHTESFQVEISCFPTSTLRGENQHDDVVHPLLCVVWQILHLPIILVSTGLHIFSYPYIGFKRIRVNFYSNSSRTLVLQPSN